VLDSLRGTEKQWLVDVMYAFNAGKGRRTRLAGSWWLKYEVRRQKVLHTYDNYVSKGKFEKCVYQVHFQSSQEAWKAGGGFEINGFIVS